MHPKAGSVQTLPIGSERSVGTEAFKARYFKNGAHRRSMPNVAELVKKSENWVNENEGVGRGE